MRNSNPFDFEGAIRRVGFWILGLAALGTVGASLFRGPSTGAGFLLGAIAAYLNYRLIERAVNRLANNAAQGSAPAGRGTGVLVFIQFTALLLGAFVIIHVSGFSAGAALCGFLVCPAGAVLEMIYELITYDHS